MFTIQWFLFVLVNVLLLSNIRNIIFCIIQLELLPFWLNLYFIIFFTFHSNKTIMIFSLKTSNIYKKGFSKEHNEWFL